VTEARFNELPPAVKQTFDQRAKFTLHQPSGESLFRDMFYRFFFVHELGHGVQDRVLSIRAQSEGIIPETEEDYYQDEIQSNRIAIAWWHKEFRTMTTSASSLPKTRQSVVCLTRNVIFCWL